MITIIAGIGGALLGACGFAAGIPIGVAATVGGGAVGLSVGATGEHMANTARKVSDEHIKITKKGKKEIKKGVKVINDTSSFAKKEIKNITSFILPGGIMLITGMIGAGLVAKDCNLTCKNLNVEFFRCVSIVLLTAGIKMLSIPVMRSYKN